MDKLDKIAFELGTLDTAVYREYVVNKERADVAPLVVRAKTLLSELGANPALAEMYADIQAMNDAAQGEGGFPEALRAAGGDRAAIIHNLAGNLSLWLFLASPPEDSGDEEKMVYEYIVTMLRTKYNRFSSTYNKKLATLGLEARLPDAWYEEAPVDEFQAVYDEMRHFVGFEG